MKKFYKKAATIGLASVLGASALASLVGCGGDSEKLSVYIFAGSDDITTNSELVYAWGKQYKAKMIKEGVWTEETAPALDSEAGYDLSFDSDTTTYFATVKKKLVAGKAPDIFYVSPKYVKDYANKNYVLDLSKYVDFSAYPIADVWGSALGFYGYDAENKIIGEELTYDKASNSFKNEHGGTAGVYGLPKDLSSFGLAYNANFFTDADKAAYQSTSAASFGDAGVITTLDGKDAKGVVAINTPITYKPYNFYNYKSYAEALAAGDPVAAASNSIGGYTVTMPGFPGETFEIKAADQEKNVAYDASIGYVTYTYAEYSAISWAICYYQYKANGKTVYANDQYEGTLYLLPWLYGNDADYISKDYTKCTAVEYTDEDGDGKKTQTGYDSDNFIEAYAAFLAYGSDWNGNSYYVGDGNLLGGWDSFNAGKNLFYGCGTWDMPSLNSTEKSVLDYQTMPEPVSEDYALYSKIKNSKYEAQEYGTKKASYTADEAYKNQLARQDQWGARLDSVGYGANAKLAKLAGGKLEWKAKAAADLVAFLTIDPATQVQLTYAGSQLPNYSTQCSDYLYYMTKEDSVFKYMITPDNTAANPNVHNANMTWDKAYNELVPELRDCSEKTTVKDWFAANHPDYKYNEQYGSKKMSSIKTISQAMSVLNMISYNFQSRNIMLRQNSGVNGAKDSAMYTYDTKWMSQYFADQKETYLIAYSGQIVDGWKKVDKGALDEGSGKYYTPYEYCKHFAPQCQELLDDIAGL